MLRCLRENNISLVLAKVHKRAYNNHIGGKSLIHKLLRAGYYRSTLMKYWISFIKKCDQYQRHADVHHASAKLLQSMTFPWPFYLGGMDILGPFPMAPGKLKFLIVRVGYLSKWIEAEVMDKFMTERVQHFYWQKIMCWYSLPNSIVSDNGTQLTSEIVTYFYKELGMQIKFVHVVHPQANGQAESPDMTILKGLMKKLDDAKGLWAELLHEILWPYHTNPLPRKPRIPWFLGWTQCCPSRLRCHYGGKPFQQRRK